MVQLAAGTTACYCFAKIMAKMDDIRFIYEVEKRPHLYVLTHKLYKKTGASTEAWDSIGAIFGKTGKLMYFFLFFYRKLLYSFW